MSDAYYKLETDEQKIEYNKELCNKYPWLKAYDVWTGKLDENYDYSFTELDCLPKGWRIAFGEEMCQEIQECLDKIENYPPKYYDGEESPYRIEQIKEKFGGLRWYTNWTNEDLDNVIRKYENLSEKTCVKCGKKATKISQGWICPYCDKCAKESNKICFVDINDFYKEED